MKGLEGLDEYIESQILLRVSQAKRDAVRTRRRKTRISAAYREITGGDIRSFADKLKVCNSPGAQVSRTMEQECWIYHSETTGAYSYHSFHGSPFGAHRFALAIKLHCKLSDLNGYDAAHIGKDRCTGKRCCNPAHLFKQLPPENRTFERKGQKPAKLETPAEIKAKAKNMIANLYPEGLPIQSEQEYELVIC